MAQTKVNDQYWFDYSQKLVDAAQEARHQAAERLQKLALWLWGIYTAAAAIGFALADKKLDFWPSVVIALPSVGLVAVYWATVWVQMPLSVRFDPRSPDDIRLAHALGARTKARRLRVALGLSMVAAVMVAAALVTASLAAPPPRSASLQVVGREEGGEVQLALTVAIAGAPRVTVKVAPEGSATVESFAFLLQEGKLQTAIRLASRARKYTVGIEWPGAGAEKDATLTMARVITIEPAARQDTPAVTTCPCGDSRPVSGHAAGPARSP